MVRIELKNIRIASLIPHEDVIEERVREIVEEIKVRGLRYPIVVDRESRIIIDGHHRVEAFRRLGLAKIPAILVNYGGDLVEIRRWFYIYKRRNEPIDIFYTTSSEIITKVIRRIVRYLRPGNVEIVIKTLRYHTKIFHDNLYEAYWLLHNACVDLPLMKIPEDQYCGEIPVIYTPNISKYHVIMYAKMGRILPPKTTRHIFFFEIPEIKYRV